MEEKTPALLLSGFAKGNGAVVHIVVDDIYLMCTRNHKEPRIMETEEGYTLDDVTCAKCRRSAFFKTLEVEMSQVDPPAAEKPSELIQQELPLEKQPDNAQTDQIEAVSEADNIPANGEGTPDHEKAEKTDEKQPKSDKKADRETAETPETEDTETEDTENSSISPDRDNDTKGDIIKQPAESEKVEATESEKVEVENKPSLPLSDPASIINNALDEIEGQFKAVMKANRMYSIVHVASDQEFFFPVDPAAVVHCLLLLNNLKDIWDGKGNMPKDFSSCCNRAFKLGYSASGMAQTSMEDLAKEREAKAAARKEKKKANFKIRRRDKSSIRRREKTDDKISIRRRPQDLIGIKRRNKTSGIRRRARPDIADSDEKFLFRHSSPKAFIVELISKRPTEKKTVIRRLMKKFLMDKAQATLYFTMAVREAVRHKGKAVDIIMRGSNTKGMSDLYHIKL